MHGILCKSWVDWAQRSVGSPGSRAVMWLGTVALWLSLLGLPYVASRLSCVERELLAALGPEISDAVQVLRSLRILIWALFCILSFDQCVLNPMLCLKALQEVLREVERQRRGEPERRSAPGSDDDQRGGELVATEQ